MRARKNRLISSDSKLVVIRMNNQPLAMLSPSIISGSWT